MRSQLVALSCVWIAMACDGPPSSIATPEFPWRVDVQDLDESLLAGCGDDELAVVVGGTANGDAFIMEQVSYGEWSVPPLPAAKRLWWCAQGPDGSIVAVGEERTFLTRSAQGEWSKTLLPGSPDTNLYGVWNRAGEWIVVGGSPRLLQNSGVILRTEGEVWIENDLSNLESSTLFKIWGTDDQLWAVGFGGTILHSSDGNTWTRQASPTPTPLIGVWGASATSVYAVGGVGQGLILHFDGSTWETFATSVEPLTGVWTANARDLYVAGNFGFLARYGLTPDGGHDSQQVDSVTLMDSRICLHALHGTSERVLAIGANLTSGARDGWRGGILSNGKQGAGNINWPELSDAGPSIDAGISDASVDDASNEGVGPGQVCFADPSSCRPGLQCWGVLATSGPTAICTELCGSAAECVEDYGPTACCQLPGPQATLPVCLPGDYVACN